MEQTQCYNRNSMQAAASVIPEILAELLRVVPREEAVRLAWPMVCGSRVAARTTAGEFARGVLQVQVPDRAWCAELSGLEAHYRQELKRLLGRDTVRQIVFRES